MRKSIFLLLLALACASSGLIHAAPTQALSPEEVSGIQEELKTCDKAMIGKVESVRKTNHRVPNKDVAEWEYSIRLRNNRIIKTLAYPERKDDLKRYIGQTVCGEEKDHD